MAAISSAGCFHFDAWTPVPGVEPGVSTENAVASWSCEGGDQLSLLARADHPSLHRASNDLVVSSSWSDADGTHFFVTSKSFGFEQLVSAHPATEDVLTRRFAALGGWIPKDAQAQYPDGQAVGRLDPYTTDEAGHPHGDPYLEELCWAKDGPLATAATAAGRKPIDLLYFGAERFHGEVPASAKPLKATVCRSGAGGADESAVPPPLAHVFIDEGGTSGGATLWIVDPQGDDDHGILVHQAKDDGGGCSLSYSMPGADCLSTAKMHAMGGRVFYWEHVRTGYELFQGKSDGGFLLHVFAPSQVTKAPLPPNKTALGHPLDPNSEAMSCVYDD